MGPRGGYFLKSGAEGRVFLKEWGRGEFISQRMGPRGGYFFKSGVERRVFLIESEHTLPNLLIFPSLLFDSRLLFAYNFFHPPLRVYC